MLETNSLTGLLAFFFYEHRYLSIPQLGRLELSADLFPQAGQNHPHSLPEGSIAFIPDPSEKPDPQLVAYITARTRKMEALAIADLNSLSDLAREMLNMRQAYTFPGIATITPDARGKFMVTPEKLLSQSHHAMRQTASDMFRQDVKEDLIEGSEIYSSGTRRTFGGSIIAVICLVIVVVLIYFLFLHKESDTRDLTSGMGSKIAQHSDSSSMHAGGSAGTASSVSQGGNRHTNALAGGNLLHYEVVFEQADSMRAIRRYNQLTGWGHRIIMKKEDSAHYSLAVPVTGPVTDTTAIKDSIRILYGHPVFIRYLSSG